MPDFEDVSDFIPAQVEGSASDAPEGYVYVHEGGPRGQGYYINDGTFDFLAAPEPEPEAHQNCKWHVDEEEMSRDPRGFIMAPSKAERGDEKLTDFEDYMKTVRERKAEGVDRFKSSSYTGQRDDVVWARNRYSDALYYLEQAELEPEAKEHMDEIRSLKISLLLNRAQARLELKHNDGAAKDGADVLALDKDNLKALYRRGVAMARMKEFAIAKKCLRRAAELSPKDKKIRAAYNEAKANADAREKERKAWKDPTLDEKKKKAREEEQKLLLRLGEADKVARKEMGQEAFEALSNDEKQRTVLQVATRLELEKCPASVVRRFDEKGVQLPDQPSIAGLAKRKAAEDRAAAQKVREERQKAEAKAAFEAEPDSWASFWEPETTEQREEEETKRLVEAKQRERLREVQQAQMAKEEAKKLAIKRRATEEDARKRKAKARQRQRVAVQAAEEKQRQIATEDEAAKATEAKRVVDAHATTEAALAAAEKASAALMRNMHATAAIVNPNASTDDDTSATVSAGAGSSTMLSPLQIARNFYGESWKAMSGDEKIAAIERAARAAEARDGLGGTRVLPEPVASTCGDDINGNVSGSSTLPLNAIKSSYGDAWAEMSVEEKRQALQAATK